MALSEQHDLPNAELLAGVPLNPEYAAGARNAVRTCLAVQPGEVVAVVTDDQTRDVAVSLLHALYEVEAAPSVLVLEELAPRPLRRMPPAVLRRVATSSVAIACLQPREGEIASR